MKLGEALRQRQAEAGPLLLAPVPCIELLELPEQAAQVCFGDPDPGVAHSNLDPRVDLSSSYRHPPTLRGELDCVGHQIEEHLLQFCRVGDQMKVLSGIALDR